MKTKYKISYKVDQKEIIYAKIDAVAYHKKRTYLRGAQKLYGEGITSFLSSVEVKEPDPEYRDIPLFTEIIWTFEYERGVQDPEDYSTNDPLVFFDIKTGIEIRRTPFWKESEAVPKGQNCLLLSQYMQYAKQNNIEVKPE